MLKNEQMKVLFVGWLEDFKGVLNYLVQQKVLLQSGKNIQFTFVGNKVLRPKPKCLQKRVTLKKTLFSQDGKVDELHEYYKNNIIFILPSWSEGFPNAAIEAMAAGLAVGLQKLELFLRFLLIMKISNFD